MNRKEFLDILEKNLGKLPAEEKNDAINYYRELFNEAGKDGEQQIIDDLDAPEDIAEQILRENGISSDTEPEYLPETLNESGKSEYKGPDIEDVKPTKNDNNTLLLVVLILVLTSPVWGGLAAGILGAVFGILVAVVCILFAFCVASIALIAAGVAITFSAPPFGLIILGTGLVLSGIASLVLKPVVKGLFKLAVLIVNKCVDLVKKLINRKRSVQ